jgi:hypothetical protein
MLTSSLRRIYPFFIIDDDPNSVRNSDEISDIK